MQRKCISVLMCVVVVTSLLVGCGKKSEEAKAVIDKINSIGSVDYDDETLIGECEDAYLALTTEQQAEVSNFDTLTKAREKMDQLLEAKPIPFSTANWESTKEDVKKIMGKEPDSEYDTDSGDHVLQYDSMEYEGYSGLVRYCFEGETLSQVLFVMESFDADAYKHFNDQFTTKYGEPGFENEFGKVWYRNNANFGVTGYSMFGGSIIVTFHKPKEG